MLKVLKIGRLPSTSLVSNVVRQFSLFNGSRLARFHPKLRFTQQKRPVGTPKENGGQPKSEIQPDQIPIRPLRDLWKAGLFTVGIGVSTYTIAAICEYVRMKQLKNQVEMQGFFSDFFVQNMIRQFNGLNERHENEYPELTTGQKAAFAIIAINCLVTLVWSIPRVRPIMYRYFTNSFASKSLCSPMLLSVFSHNNIIHLAVNMYVLHSFTPVAIERFLGIEQFVALYLTSGVFSSFTSLIHKSAVRSNIRALGASGAICALLAYTCMKIPDARLAVIFLPFIQFSAEQAVYGLIAFDLLGLIFRFRMFDHAAHLGGTMFGVLYAMYGEHWIRYHFNPKVFKECKEAENDIRKKK